MSITFPKQRLPQSVSTFSMTQLPSARPYFHHWPFLLLFPETNRNMANRDDLYRFNILEFISLILNWTLDLQLVFFTNRETDRQRTER